ncbi:hypothetical protein [Intestinimonas butyriciproducens]|uniref:hypothetical protein n=1 Tax=Intestinimonas butyriciproducens TaxID=1297617 RepID=UPI00189AFBC2|nr:hypothetical protein [Intestinimonas butyriciproducens]MDB7829191.1 hypothetical protein [Intestinimonas butyriciproducens]
MGYYTDYTLDVCTATRSEDSFTTANYISPLIKTQLEDEIEKLDVFEGGNCDDGWYGNAKWYDWEEDMLLLSKRFPEVMLTLGGIGEEFGDIWELISAMEGCKFARLTLFTLHSTHSHGRKRGKLRREIQLPAIIGGSHERF